MILQILMTIPFAGSRLDVATLKLRTLKHGYFPTQYSSSFCAGTPVR
jgi:hypothetical protein